jgi:hypothetical protein
MTAEIATTPLASHAIAPSARVEIMLPNGPAFPVPFYCALDLVVLDPGGQYRPVRPARVPLSIAHLVTTGGMAGWQITLIAPGRPPDHPPGSCTTPEPGPSRQEKTMTISRAASGEGQANHLRSRHYRLDRIGGGRLPDPAQLDRLP